MCQGANTTQLVRPDAHLGWRGRADPGVLDRWLTAMALQGRAG